MTAEPASLETADRLVLAAARLREIGADPHKFLNTAAMTAIADALADLAAEHPEWTDYEGTGTCGDDCSERSRWFPFCDLILGGTR